MKTVIVVVGGSRGATNLPPAAIGRLDTALAKGVLVVVGDAPGADRAFQEHLHRRGYRRVLVFCSGQHCRNNLAGWETRKVFAPESGSALRFHTAKDRAMAEMADAGLMVWDGTSLGTALNIARLVLRGRPVYVVSTKTGEENRVQTREEFFKLLFGLPDETFRGLNAELGWETHPIQFNSSTPQWSWLSNFYGSPITVEVVPGLEGWELRLARWFQGSWPTAEHLYQAGKTPLPEKREWIRAAPSPQEAKRRARLVPVRPDWNKWRLQFMRWVVRMKYASNPGLARALAETYPRELVHFCPWGDQFWGVDREGRGENRLGQITMVIRLEAMKRGEISRIEPLIEPLW